MVLDVSVFGVSQNGHRPVSWCRVCGLLVLGPRTETDPLPPPPPLSTNQTVFPFPLSMYSRFPNIYSVRSIPTPTPTPTPTSYFKYPALSILCKNHSANKKGLSARKPPPLDARVGGCSSLPPPPWRFPVSSLPFRPLTRAPRPETQLLLLSTSSSSNDAVVC